MNKKNKMTKSKVIDTIKKRLCGKKRIDKDVFKFIQTFDFTQLIDKSNFKKGKYVKDSLISCCNFSLYCIYWSQDSYCPPHNHPKGGCILRILQGSILEKTYELVKGKAEFIQKNRLSTGTVGTKYGNELHSMTPLTNTVAIHIYFPGDYKPEFFDIRCNPN